MTSKMIDEGRDRRIQISCDGHGCDQQHDNEAIALGGGLHNMGWKTQFDDAERVLRHFCPAHVKAVDPA